MKIPKFQTTQDLVDWVGWHIERELADQIKECLDKAHQSGYSEGYRAGFDDARSEYIPF